MSIYLVWFSNKDGSNVRLYGVYSTEASALEHTDRIGASEYFLAYMQTTRVLD